MAGSLSLFSAPLHGGKKSVVSSGELPSQDHSGQALRLGSGQAGHGVGAGWKGGAGMV